MMSSKLGPRFSLHGVARSDWTSSLQSDFQIVFECQSESFLLEVLSPSFRKKLLESPVPSWIYIGQVLREDEEVLFAFEHPQERSLFEELRSIDGIGPKTAALLVGKIGLAGFREIINNPKSISQVKVPGLGPKNLEKISLGLKQKKEHFLGIVGLEVGATDSSASFATSSSRSDLERALTSLGLRSSEARELFRQMSEENSSYGEMPLPQLLQEALKHWGRSRAPKDTAEHERTL